MSRSDSILLIPDLHQDIDFLQEVQGAIQKGYYGRIIFLGDYFDPYTAELEEVEVLQRYCRMLKGIMEDLAGRVTFLWGNHDLPYYLAREHFRDRKFPYLKEHVEWALQFTMDKALIIEEELGMPFWDRLELITEAQGYVLTHAGLHPYWLKSWKLRPVLLQVRQGWNALIKDFPVECENDLKWLVDAGPARGGTAKVSGPLWLDWEQEFDDIPGLPQIVGHSRGRKLRQNGESFCIDCGQSAWACLEPDGPILIHD